MSCLKYIVILFCLLSKIRSFDVKVNIKQGLIIGKRELTLFNENLYYAFYGVPYARAPVGKLRFKDPKPVNKWTKPLDASTEYHGACAQAHIVHKHGQYGFENCLYLNIYTPNLPLQNKQTLKAVIVWIHGYAFTSSFSHIHGADFLIDNDVIVITLTHRIGAFGFLKVNETDSNANMGLKDIVIGLKWIKTNIRYFGGDKKKITVMGSGSASTLISLLLVTKYRKLFSKMILQSGSIFSPSIFQRDYKIEKYVLEKEIKRAGIKDIKSALTKDIIQASQKIYNSKDIINFQRSVVPFSPVVEKESNKSLLTMNISEAYKVLKKFNFSNTSILIGFTSQESIPEIIPFIHNKYYLKLFQTHFKFKIPFEDGCKYDYSSKKYERISKEIRNWYFKQGISENSLDDLLRFVSDLHKYPIYKFIKLVTSVGSKIFVYKFNYVGKFNAVKTTSLAGSAIRVKGAAQGDEICYILKCDPLWESYVKLREHKYDKDRIFIENLTQMWANFAKTGEPTSTKSNGNITWPPMTSNEDNVFLFGKHNKLINSDSEQKMLQFWDEMYRKYYDLKNCQLSKDEL